MKVLLTADRVGGVFQHTHELARGLSARGIEVELALLGPQPAKTPTASLPDQVNVHEVPGALEWMDDSEDEVTAAAHRLASLAEATGCDLAHLNGYAYAQATAWSIPVVVGAHSTLHGWWEAVRGSPPPEDWEPYRTRTRAGLCRADRVVAPTRAMLRELERHYCWLGKRGRVVANGADPDQPDVEKRERVLWSGRAWDPAKGLDLLDAAGAGGLGWPVLAAGPTAGPAGQEAPRTRHVEPLGHVEEAPYRQLLAESAIYVSTARYEPFGLGPLEAAATGAALVLPAIDTLQELWQDAAVFYAPEDAEGLHAAVQDLIADRAYRDHFAAAARTRAACHGRERMVQDMLQVYGEIAPEAMDAVPKETLAGQPGSRVTLQEAS